MRETAHGPGTQPPGLEIWALQDVSFEVPEGQVLGIIGRNGAGKSTLLKILTRIVSPTAGRAEIRGRVGSLLEVGTGFNQELTGRENVYLNGAILGMKRKEIEQRFDDIVEFSGVEKFIDTPVKRYSSGMYVRLAFAVAAHLEPEILLVDEVLSVGDAEFQRRCLGRMEELGEHRPDGRLRLARPAGGRAALRPSDLDRRRQARRRWDRARDDRELPAPDAQRRHRARLGGRRGTRERAGQDPGDQGARTRGDAARHRRRPTADRDRDRVRRASRRQAAVPEDQGARPGGRDRLQRDGHGRAVARAATPGTYVATAWIPGNLLNEGSAIVEVAICSIDFPKLEHHAAVYEAVSFEVLDPGEGDSARGLFSGQWRGVVRPLLEWTCERA